jgi:hypothetical protein
MYIMTDSGFHQQYHSKMALTVCNTTQLHIRIQARTHTHTHTVFV